MCLVTLRTVGGAVGGVPPDWRWGRRLSDGVCAELPQCAVLTSLGKSPRFIIIKVSVASLPLSRRVGVSQDATRAVKRVKVAVICRGMKETSSVQMTSLVATPVCCRPYTGVLIDV